jgi:hypothetical protein
VSNNISVNGFGRDRDSNKFVFMRGAFGDNWGNGYLVIVMSSMFPHVSNQHLVLKLRRKSRSHPTNATDFGHSLMKI